MRERGKGGGKWRRGKKKGGQGGVGGKRWRKGGRDWENCEVLKKWK